MERPRNHVIETSSAKILQSIVPDEWVLRDLKPDYGLDYLVEIFEGSQATGKMFFVQLKGSDKETTNREFKYSFEIDHLAYYNRIATPVLIVFVSVAQELIWSIWSNNIINCFVTLEDQKTRTITLGEDCLTDKEKLRMFSRNLTISGKVGINFTPLGELESVYSTKLSEWISRFYEQYFTLDCSNVPIQFTVSFESSSAKCTGVSIKGPVQKKDIVTIPFGIDSEFLHKPLFDLNDVHTQNIEFLIFCVVNFASIAIRPSLTLLLHLLRFPELKEHFKIEAADIFALFRKAKLSGEIELFNKVVERFLDLDFEELFFAADLAYFIESKGTSEMFEYRIKNLTKAYSVAKTNESKAVALYNLGAVHRKNVNISKASRCYFEAKDLDPAYPSRAYWWSEMAGVLFLRRHYKWAEAFYRRAVELNELNKNIVYPRVEITERRSDEFFQALIGDCLFFQAKFPEAEKAYGPYLTQFPGKVLLWDLRYKTCELFIQNGFVGKSSAMLSGQQELEMAIASQDPEKSKNILEKIIEIYPLNSLAWYNLGATYNKLGRAEEALVSYVTAAVILDNDVEAQYGALVLAIQVKNSYLMWALSRLLVQIHGSSVINRLTEFIWKQNYETSYKRALIKILTEMLQKANEK